MQKLLKEYLDDLNKRQKKRKKAVIASLLLVVLVVGSVLGSLTQYGIAMTDKERCGLEEHEHTEMCYQNVLICGYEDIDTRQEEEKDIQQDTIAPKETKEVHQHTEDCYETKDVPECTLEESEGHTHSEDCYEMADILTCEVEESEGHTHSEDCYESEEVLDCEEEHEHTEDCYEMVDTLTCGEEESEGHTHGGDCYESERTLTCEEEENEGHTHDEGCYGQEEVLKCGEEENEAEQSESPALETSDAAAETKADSETNITTHTHTEDCYECQLICGLEEHEHTDECRIDKSADVEDMSIWDAQYADVEWADSWGEDLVTAARVQVGYRESTDNYQIAEDGSHRGYTRYGEFAGDPYIDWDAAFVNFCMYYAGLAEEGVFPNETDTGKWYNAFVETAEKNVEYLTAADDYEPKIGDLVFFERENYENEEKPEQVKQMGIVSAYDTEKNEITVIEGGSNQEVKENTYDLGNTRENEISEYLMITELEAAVTNVKQNEWQLTDTMKEQDPKRIPDFAGAISVEGSAEGKMVLELRYGQDKSRHDELDAQVQSPHYAMVGYFDLYADSIEGDLYMEDLTITLHIPRKYIDKNSIKFLQMPENINARISEVTEEEEYYNISVIFPEYMQTGQMQYQFQMNFLGGAVPVDYDLKIKATISCNGEKDDTAENIYRPEYRLPKFVKYVNTNQYDSMAKDYTRVSAIIDENGMISDSEYVSFWYKMGGDPIHGLDGCFYREYDQITLTDILPTYEKYVTNAKGEIEYGTDNKPKTEIATAVFDPDVNPGWTLSEDAKTVSRIITTDKSCLVPAGPDEDNRHWRAAIDLQKQIEKVELKLLFPGCVINEKANDGFLKKDLKNYVEADCHPRDPSDTEENDVLKDDLIFTLTNQPAGSGFAKYNSSNVIMDTQTMRAGLYQWGIKFENSESTIPLSNISLTDYELDDRLKICTLRLLTEGKDEYNAIKRIDRVEAVTYDDETDKYYADQFENRPYDYDFGWYQELVLNPEREYKSFTVYMKDDCVLKQGEMIHIRVCTTFRKPDERHYVNDGVQDSPQNVYHNGAKVDYWVKDTFFKVTSGNQFSLIDTRENISIKKFAMYGNDVELGKEKYWQIEIIGSLADSKKYEDLRVIDLLPEPLALPKNQKGEWEIRYGTGGNYVKESTVVENYKNTGRMAVIFDMNTDEVRKVLDASDGETGKCMFTFRTEVPLDARVGMFDNDIWILSNDFEMVTTQSSAPDIYDLDGDGDKTEMIRYSTDSCNIKSPSGIYAEKAIAPVDIETWRTSSLFLGVGDMFRYKLSVVNAADSAHTGLLVYDVLPRIGDPNISNSDGRKSEYTVNLSGFIVPPEGYQIFYTTSGNVYHKSMVEILGNKLTSPDPEVKWLTEKEVASDRLEEITAFKIVADEGTMIHAKGRAEFIIPAKVTDVLEEKSYELLGNKESVDKDSGTATYLVSTNSFGYRVSTFSGSNLESNYVRAQIPFAGFVIKKTDDGDTKTALAGAEFRLEKQQSVDSGENGAKTGEGMPTESWVPVTGYENAVTGADGILSFKNLTEGTYRLTETKAPAGYSLNTTPIPVTITLNRDTMEYSVVIDGNILAGNSKNPFEIVNHAFYELPSTGGIGREPYALAGMILMMAAVGLLCQRRARSEIR